jgi:putative hemolysin
MFSVEEIVQTKIKEPRALSLFEKIMIFCLRILLHEKQFAEFDAKYSHLRGLDSVEQILEHLQIRCETDTAELENIPSHGAVVLIANHPTGMLDGLTLIKTAAAVRPDVKIVANQILSHLKPLKSIFITVNNMNDYANRQQIKDVQTHLLQQGALIIFPSGEVSRFGLKGIRDGKWSSGFIRLAAKARAPIVPVYIEGRNSLFFYLLSLIYKPLSTYLLVHEVFARKKQRLKIRIGRRIPYTAWYDGKTSANEQAKRFKRHIYKIAKGKSGIMTGEAPIALPFMDKAALKAAVEGCETLGKTPDGKLIQLYRRADTDNAAPILHELGRLREIAFRAVGEGSGRRLDLDIYDDYYYHLILWDTQKLEIIGAYRFIPTFEELNRDGGKRLYSRTLFNYHEDMAHVLEHGIELGRSFIQPAHWGKRGLDYLWQGIGAYLACNGQYRYLFGPVSISAVMPVVARDLLISFYRLYFAPKQLIAVSKQPYPASLPQVLANFSGNDYQEDFKRLKNMLANMNCAIPTLYKQYSELCEPGGVQFMDFGLDPDFNNCIDGLMLLDIKKLKASRYERYIAPYLRQQAV